MLYKNIVLELPDKKPQMSHSDALAIITGRDRIENMEWLDKLGQVPWGQITGSLPEHYEEACLLFSLYHLDYQTCNGGIEQYFFNGYHEGKSALHENDVELFDIDEQKKAFQEMVKFARDLFPERTEENDALSAAANAFDGLSYEEDCAVPVTVYCDEDQYILDEETGEEIENPDYFEPYDDVEYENVIHGDNGFDRIFYKANDYLEELFEVRAQFLCKNLAREVEKSGPEHAQLANTLKNIMPEAFSGQTLADRIRLAEIRAKAEQRGASAPAKENER